jgi:MerR family transcriptional regulator, thiopeptide resistance regulator
LAEALRMNYQIGEVAKLAKLSIRMLRHYDEIGLLVPSGRTEAGYRLYSTSDLQRLQQILFYRMLEFPLDAIAQFMTAPDFDEHAALLQQRELIRKKASDLSAVLQLIDQAITRHETTAEENYTMNASELFEVFPDMKQEYLDEAKERWGSSTAWRQSAQRMKNYSKNDLERMKAEMHEIQSRFEDVFRTGNAPDSAPALAAVDAARLHIQKWFYDCSLQFHVNLTAMTSMDERFVKNIDKNCPGLASFIHEAAKANLARG